MAGGRGSGKTIRWRTPPILHTTRCSRCRSPSATNAEAEAIARDLFGVAGRAEPLPGERDLNLRIVPETGSGWVLKISNTAEDRAVVAMQSAALRHIATRDPALPVPRVCATRAGGNEALVALADGTSHIVRLLTFLPGEPLPASSPSRSQAAAIGTHLARIGLALADFVHPAASYALLWDLQRAPCLVHLLGHVGEPRRRALARDTLERHARRIAPGMAAFRRQIVHNDFNPHNLVVDAADPDAIVGVLDFGDMVETALVNDVAVAASYQIGPGGELDRIAALVGAYHATAPLRREEIGALPDLIQLRFAMSVVIPEWRASLHPGNRPYILRNHARAAAALEAFDRIGLGAVRRTLRHACLLE